MSFVSRFISATPSISRRRTEVVSREKEVNKIIIETFKELKLKNFDNQDLVDYMGLKIATMCSVSDIGHLTKVVQDIESEKSDFLKTNYYKNRLLKSNSKILYYGV